MQSISLAVAGGFRIVVPADPRRLSTYVFLEQEDWFEDEAPFIRALIEPGERVLDIGANLGFYSLSAAQAAGPDGRIWAFEPTPDIARRLCASAALNGFAALRVVETALGDTRGQAFLGRGDNHELNRIVPSASQGVPVVIERLDDWAASEPAARGVGFVKMDVEGHEDSVVAGGIDFFTRESPLVMLEISDGQTIRDDAVQRLRGLGYDSYRLLPELGILVPFSGPRPDTGILNLFAAKPDRAAHLAARGLLAPSLSQASLADPLAVAAMLSAQPALAPHRDDLRRAMARLLPEGPYAAALRGWVACRDAALPAAVRAASLTNAFDAVQAAVAERTTASRLLTAGRIAHATGRRALAAEAAQQIVRILLEGRPMTLGEPFLPLLPFYEGWASPSGLTGWVGAMAIEAYWRWASFSTYFHNADFAQQDPVALLRRFGREAPFFERRRVLNAWTAKKPVQPHPMLLRHAPDNLNPEYWSGQPVPAAAD